MSAWQGGNKQSCGVRTVDEVLLDDGIWGFLVLGLVSLLVGWLTGDWLPCAPIFAVGWGFGWGILAAETYEIRLVRGERLEFRRLWTRTAIPVVTLREIGSWHRMDEEDGESWGLVFRHDAGAFGTPHFPSVQRLIWELRLIQPGLAVSGDWPPVAHTFG